MSEQSPPYFYKEESSNIYHWEITCSENQWPSSGWKKANIPPPAREKCDECKAK